MTFISTIIDLTNHTKAAYELASEILQTKDNEITYLEMHKKLGHKDFRLDNSNGSFRDLAKEFDIGFTDSKKVDTFPASIDVLLQLNRLRFQIENCGENTYVGFGPQGILKLREACCKRGVKMEIRLIE